MANTQLTQTGAQVQAILDKADKLPSSLGTAGQVLAVNSGATGTEWQTPSASHFHMSWTSQFYGSFKLWLTDGTSIRGIEADYRSTYDVLCIEFKLNDASIDFVNFTTPTCPFIIGAISSSVSGGNSCDHWYFCNGVNFDATPLTNITLNSSASYNVVLIPLTSGNLENFSITYD